MELLLPVLAVLAFALIWLAVTYNAFVRLRNHCMESWAAIDTELRRRHDLIPNLVETVKGYATFERDLLDRVTQARTAAHDTHGTAGSQARVERELVGGLKQLIAVAESYPELKAHRHYLELQTELSHTEDRLQRARRFYNANVRDLNTRTEVFPSSVVASMFDVKRWEYFEVEESVVRSNPRVELT